jgi:hypothetical protein
VTTISTPTTTATAPRITALIGTGLAAIVAAGAATMIVAAAGRAAGVSLDVSGAPIPISGFAVMTALCSAVGLILAAVLSRTTRHPRRVFVRTTVVLTVLSLVPDLIADAAPGTKALLMLTHLVAAAIVIPAVARRLSA